MQSVSQHQIQRAEVFIMEEGIEMMTTEQTNSEPQFP